LSVFRRLRERLEAALAAATPPPDLGEIAAGMREAVIEQKAGVRAVREALAESGRLLETERARLETARRRRELAAGIEDGETVEVADRFVAKHSERVAVLERKVLVQQEELSLAERDLAEMTAQLQEAVRRVPQAERSANDAWRTLAEAGGERPGVDSGSEVLRSQLDRAMREASAEQRLEELKKKMGR
jgi:hypothetical protein